MPASKRLPPSFLPHGFARLRGLALVVAGALLAGCVALPVSKQGEEPAQADRVEQARQAARPSALCSAQPGSPFAFRKKVLVLALPVQRPFEVAYLPDLAVSWSGALQQRLQGTDRFLIRNGSTHYLNPADNVRKQIVDLAQQFDAQFVIAGRITSLDKQPGRIELGPLGAIEQPFGERRLIETELEVFDGHSGTRLKQLAYNTEVQGAVENRGSGTLRGDFFRTPLGEAVAKMLDRQTEDIADELACLPMQARIVSIRSHEVHIDAGFTSNLKSGDQLRVLQRVGFSGGDGGQADRSVGNLIIKQVFPESAVGYLEGDAPPDWRFNGFVRAW